MKPNKRNTTPQAQKVFTDRDEPRKVFWDAYQECKGNMESPIIKVITYYGIGGIGKTRLLRQLRTEVKERIKEPQFIYIDFGTNTETQTILSKMRNMLQSEYQFEFPIFDIALYAYYKKIGEEKGKQEIQSLTEKSRTINSIVDMLGTIPIVGFVPTLLKGIDNLFAASRNNILDRKIELFEIQNEDPDIILHNLPYYFAGDLENNLKKSKEPFIVFFDTYEALVNELSGIGDPLGNDDWIRNENRGLVMNVPNVLWVIAGREKIKWEKFNIEWGEALDQHLLGNLSESDTQFFLQSAGISNKTLIQEMYKLTNGTPVYIDLCVDRYFSILERNEEPSIDKIGNGINELIGRFVRYMDDHKKDLIYLLSCLEEWTEELVLQLSSNVLNGISITTIQKMSDYSVITTEDGIAYRMHQTVKEVLYNDCPAPIRTKTNQYMESYLLHKLEMTPPSNFDYIHLFNRYLIYKFRSMDTAESFSQFYHNTYLGIFNEIMNIYQFDELGRIHTQIIEYVKQQFGESVELAKCYYDYSTILFDLGRFEYAFQFASQSFELYKELIEADNVLAIKALYMLANCLDGLGKYAEAIEVAEQGQQLSMTKLGEEHQITMQVTSNLSIFYMHNGRYQEALSLAAKAYSNYARTLGEEDELTLLAMNYLSQSYSSVGNYTDAVHISKKILEITRRKYGENHLSMVRAMHNLAQYYSDVDQLEEAILLSEQALDKITQLLGDEHPDTIIIIQNLALFYGSLKHYDKAIELSDKAYALSTHILGEEHPVTLKVMSNLARNYSLIDKYEESNLLFNKALNASIKQLGEEHPDTIVIIANLGFVYMKMGKNSEAVELSEKALRLQKRILGVEHPETIAVMKTLYYLYGVELGRFNEAVELAEEVYHIYERTVGDTHPLTLMTLEDLSAYLFEAGRNDEAIKLLEKAYTTCTVAFGDDHETTAEYGLTLLNMYLLLENNEEALGLSDKSLKQFILILGEDDPDIVKAMGDLSVVYFLKERYEEAIQLTESCVKYWSSLLGEDDHSLASPLDFLSKCYYAIEEHEKSLALANKAFELCKQLMEDDPVSISVKEWKDFISS